MGRFFVDTYGVLWYTSRAEFGNSIFRRIKLSSRLTSGTPQDIAICQEMDREIGRLNHNQSLRQGLINAKFFRQLLGNKLPSLPGNNKC